MNARGQERGLRLGPLGWTLLASVALGLGVVTTGLSAPEPVSAQTSSDSAREGTIGGPTDLDWFTLFAVIGESFALTLERDSLRAGLLEVWKPATTDSPAQQVAQSAGDDRPLIWTAPESGAWRVRVSGLQSATGTYRLRVVRHVDAIGAESSTAHASSFDVDGTLIERSRLDSAGDVDWFAIPMSAQNRYTIWSVAGSVAVLSASIRMPSSESFSELSTIGNAFGDFVEPDQDGIAVLAVRASEAWMTGNYAFGVTRLGSTVEPRISLPPRRTSDLQIESIEATSIPGQAEFTFRGNWGPIRQNSGLRVWIDTDPGADEEDEWEYLLRSNDGRQARLWSFAEDAWIDSSEVGADGFDTLLMRWSGRTADARIRWQASVRNTDGSWTLARPALLELPNPQPANPPLWPSRKRTGEADPRWQRQLAAAGVVPGLADDQLVVVLDPGHGLDSGAWANGVQEAASNLDFSLRIEELLEAHGITVVLTRRKVDTAYLNLDRVFWRPDLQARPELAHIAHADLFVSIHSNANFQVNGRGLEAWYLPRWNRDDANLRLAETLLTHVQQALSDYGYPASTLSYDSTCWETINGWCDPIYVLAPFLLVDADTARRWGLDPAKLGLSQDPWAEPRNDWLWRSDVTLGEPPIDLINRDTQSGPGRVMRGNLMPTTLLELLYVTDAGDARVLRDSAAREVIARAVADGVLEYLGVE